MSHQPLEMPRHGRRHDLDWLRVGAFALLILYHIGMFYVTWDWHIKSRHASDFVEPAMALLNPWRLALLFFISGVAIGFATEREAGWRFAGKRTARLLPPIVFGMLVIVPPQTYLELADQHGLTPGIWEFYRNYLSLEQIYPMITPTWNHLWYVVYILVYTLLLLPFLPLLRRFAETGGRRVFRWLEDGRYGWRMVLIPAMPFLLYQLWLAPLFPTTHALVDDWANHANSLTVFVLGYLAAKDEGFWRAVDKALPTALATAAALALIIFAARLGDWQAVMADAEWRLVMRTVRVFYAWSAIAALLGLAQRFFNRPSAMLNYLSEAMFPYYILHQTLIILIAFPLIDAGLPAALEAAGIIAGTVFGCWFLHEIVIRRTNLLRPLFGLKLMPSGADKRPAAVRAA